MSPDFSTKPSCPVKALLTDEGSRIILPEDFLKLKVKDEAVKVHYVNLVALPDRELTKHELRRLLDLEKLMVENF